MDCTRGLLDLLKVTTGVRVCLGPQGLKTRVKFHVGIGECIPQKLFD